jgi:nucleoid DNA-binding protein
LHLFNRFDNQGVMATITKKELVSELSDATGVKHADTLAFVESFMELVSKHLAEGDEITLRTFGTFDLRVARGKIGRNPKQPNSEVMIPDRCVVRFKPSKELKSQVAALAVAKLNGSHALNGSHELNGNHV